MGKNQDEYQTNLNLLLLDDLINFKNTVQVSYYYKGLGREFYTKNEFAICSFIQYKKIWKLRTAFSIVTLHYMLIRN